MKRLSIAFAIVLIASAASVGIAAVSSHVASSYKADLSGAKVPPVATRATGEATFELVQMGTAGAGTGGVSPSGKDPLAADRDMGYVGPGIDDYPYEGIIDRGREEYGYGAGGTTAGESLRYRLNVKKIENVTAAHLHMGGATSAEGPVVASLYLGPRKGGQYSGLLAQGTITEKDLQGPLSGKSLDDLVAAIKAGDIYVNVHTAKHPEGEIRGQVEQKG